MLKRLIGFLIGPIRFFKKRLQDRKKDILISHYDDDGKLIRKVTLPSDPNKPITFEEFD